MIDRKRASLHLRGGGTRKFFTPLKSVALWIYFLLSYSLFSKTSYAEEHGHSHGHSHGHEHDHGHSHGHTDLMEGLLWWKTLQHWTTKRPSHSALLATVFVSCSSLFVMPFLPFLQNTGAHAPHDTAHHEEPPPININNSLLLKVTFFFDSLPLTDCQMLISFAVGGLLGDVFLHMLPHASAHAHAHADGVSQVSLVDDVQNMLLGLKQAELFPCK